MCARRRTYFLLLRQKKVGKEKASPGVCVPLRPERGEGGSLWCSEARRGCGTRCALARSARTTAASQMTKQACPSARLRALPPALLGAATRAGCRIRAIASLGPWCASALHRARCFLGRNVGVFAERSDGLEAEQREGPGHPFWMRLGRAGGWGGGRAEGGLSGISCSGHRGLSGISCSGHSMTNRNTYAKQTEPTEEGCARAASHS